MTTIKSTKSIGTSKTTNLGKQIKLIGAKQNNLKNLNVNFNIGEITVVTGPSGSGKSSLVFDTLYAEGQRRYVETFSAYARQFLDRMDKPQVEKIEGIPPAIAIDQTNTVRTSRSSVGTMTELNDHLKLFFARAGKLFDQQTALAVQNDSPLTVYQQLLAKLANQDNRLIITFAITCTKTEQQHSEQMLAAAGFSRIHKVRKKPKTNQVILDVVIDRLRWPITDKARLLSALEQAFKHGKGNLTIYQIKDGQQQAHSFSQQLMCPQSGQVYKPATPNLFSFNSALGACQSCRGFGKVIAVDYDLVIPDPKLSLEQGAIKPITTPAWQKQQQDLISYAKANNIPTNIAWQKLSTEQQNWVINGDPNWRGNWHQQWYGIKRFFSHLETKAYKMHIRILLAKYRSHTTCDDCAGARLKTEALLWRVGSLANASKLIAPQQRFIPVGCNWSKQQLSKLPGFCLHDLMLLPLTKLQQFFASIELDLPEAELQAVNLVLTEIRTRLAYLCDVGIGYLTLNRQSRTLSGGEVQRINLTTALGTALVNTLFVLDEPSIGLHPHDMQAVIRAMHKLRQSGNTLVVVEHDSAIMQHADRIIDMGPAAGAQGGQIMFDGSPLQLLTSNSLTGQYLSKQKIIQTRAKLPVNQKTARLIITGASENNLKNIDLAIPLQRLVCISGVSGSGKSTLVQQILVPALMRYFGQSSEAPGQFNQLIGAQQIASVIFVDQSPIGKTARSNPVSYINAWENIRLLFAATDLAKQRGYNHTKFSFNSGDGRCPSCTGSGFEHIEMQFLSDVYLPCAECLGKRYRPEILQINIERQQQQLNIAQVLDLTINQAYEFFSQDLAVQLALQPLLDVGLGYIKLGQPVPTLSGGEAQRLKLAGYLAQANKTSSKSRQPIANKGNLFVFDEPTTGLHFDDIAKLMQALEKLLQAGHSVLIIEHNLDVIQAADWIIDLGPTGGDQGGYIQAQGSPQDLINSSQSLTAKALLQHQKNYLPDYQVQEPSPHYSTKQPPIHLTNNIEIINATEHNLKSLSVNIPRGKFNVITGVSGSGKSTLAFDILFNEGQRRYLDSLNAYARSIVQPAERPKVDAVYGIAPTVAIEQRLSRGGNKSTVGTITEIWHFLRLLYVKLGIQHCIHDNNIVQPQNAEQMLAYLMQNYKQQKIALLAPLVIGRKGIYHELFTQAKQQGFALLRVDGNLVPTSPVQHLDRYKEHNIELVIAQLTINAKQEDKLKQALLTALRHGQGVVYVLNLTTNKTDILSSKRACPSCNTGYAELDPRLFSYNSKYGWCNSCVGTGLKLDNNQRQRLDDSVFDNNSANSEQSFTEADISDIGAEPCPDCAGTRLNKIACNVIFKQKSIVELAQFSVQQLTDWLDNIEFNNRDKTIATPILTEIQHRLKFLAQVGLSYLTIDRGAPTLSGGEAQRIRLAAQLGSNLQGVCYILDEPTIGLHQRDNQMLLTALQQLKRNNNTLVVVEHDEDTIRQAQHIIDIGPHAGINGGTLVAQGTLQQIKANKTSQTGKYLRQPMLHPLQPRRKISKTNQQLSWLQIKQARLHNLQNISLSLPLQRLVVITGVSGSGKSTLAREVLLTNLQQAITSKGNIKHWYGCASLTGYDKIKRVLEVDQSPIGKTSRSCPATYVGFWDDIRQLLAQTIEAQMCGYSASRFSFNLAQGRCDACAGNGVRTLAMSFLPDVKIQCEVCNGARFNPATLAVTWNGKNVADILQMQVDSAVEFFAAIPNIRQPLQLLKDVGLGYLTLGQPSPTLSGGEAQRIKLVTELTKVRTNDELKKSHSTPTLYVLDEPTVGLHFADIEKLLKVLHRLVDAGHSVVVVEHDLELIAEADWIIDLGPEGGNAGGQIVAQNTPEKLCLQHKSSYTATALAPILKRN